MCKHNKRAIKFGLLAVFLFLTVWLSIPFTALRVRDSAVTVHIWSGDWYVGQASGVIIDDRIILTARHIVQNATKIDITFNSGTQTVSTEFYEAEDTDLGLIIFDANEIPSKARLSFYEPFVGQAVFGVGSRYGLNSSFFKGVVGAKKRLVQIFGNKELIQLDIMGNPGDSGCGIFNRFGNVVGILVGGYNFYCSCENLPFIS